ncbi:MAG: hypothetical protein BGO55_11645 [Sphingobacteriales bacterium 50-39]|nr:hypothetical protein [Sphingobacteriales bacterium]OJW54343.1 MAG: hypothetical protein BGO55_11645 [Sphingobacteriales bacterium 50-39]
MSKIEQYLRFKDGTEWLLVDITYIDFAANHEAADGDAIKDAYERYKLENGMKELSDYAGYDPEGGIIIGAEIIEKVDGKEVTKLIRNWGLRDY